MIKYLIYILLLAPFSVNGQVTLNVQLPTAGLVEKDQLWNLVVINNSNEVLESTLSMTMQDAATGQGVLTASTGTVFFSKGIKMVTSNDLQPIQYNYLGAGTGTFLSAGNYNVCYRLTKRVRDNVQVVADQCVRVQISPLSPPLLVQPADQSEVSTTYPQFSWIPPTPQEMFTDLNYTLTVVQVDSGQSASEAILHNLPVYSKTQLTNLFEQYPSSFNSLEEGRTYAWQVQAFNGGVFAASTDVWSFKLNKQDSAFSHPRDGVYVKLQGPNEHGTVHYLKDGNLYVTYYSFAQPYMADFQLLDGTGKVVQSLKRTLLYGDNYLWIELDKKFKKEQIYTLQLIDTHHQIYKAQFSIH